MTAQLSDNSYLAIKPESTHGTAVIPTVFVPLVSSDLDTNPNHSEDMRMKGLDWAASEIRRGNRNHEGNIVFLADPDMLGHALNMNFLKGSTTGDANGYTHPFTVGTPDSYTVEIRKGIYAQRFFGVRPEELKLDFAEGQEMQVSMKVKATGQFSVAKLGIALSGSVTSLTLDDEYDIAPNRGLVVGDVLSLIKDDGSTVDLTLTSVNSNGIGVGFSSTSITAAAGNLCYLKPLTVTQPTLQDPFYLGNILVGLGADTSAADTAAGSQSTATKCYEMSITFRNKLFDKNGTNRMDPVQLIVGSRSGQFKIKQLLEASTQRTKFLDRGAQAVTIKAYGKFIKSDFTTQELLTMRFYKVKLLEHTNPLEVQDFIKDDETFAILYDESNAKAVDMSLINRTAGTAY